MSRQDHIASGESVPKIDETYLRVLHTKYFARLVYFSNSIIGDEDRAMEVVMDSFTELWKTKDLLTFETEGLIKSWLYRSAKSRSVDATRKASSYNALLEKYHSLYDTSDEAAKREFLAEESDAEIVSALYNAIEKLPKQYKRIVELKLEDLTDDEIAAELNIKPSTVRSNLTRARDLLQQRTKGDLAVMLLMISLGLMECPHSDYKPVKNTVSLVDVS
jgi:RNA polymerase sigma-70 factor (ECF subfamily)